MEAFFKSPYCESLKEQLCDIGRRLWSRAYVDGNGGNIAIKVGEDIALCTPTLVSKGFMKPSDMCLVDFEGNQLAGTKKRTSEILMHLQIMKKQPKAVATCHCHPPYSTGFAIAGLVPPTCMIPEYEVFASVAVAPYRTPGTPEMGKLVAELASGVAPSLDLAPLSPLRRAVFILRHVLGHPPESCAQLCTSTVEAVCIAEGRARRELEDYLGARCEHLYRRNPCHCTARLGNALECGLVGWPDHGDHDGSAFVPNPHSDVSALYASLPRVRLPVVAGGA